MKRRIYTIITLAVMVLSFTACESYLDVEPKGTADEDKMFSDFNGYRDAMYGAYSSIAKSGLYGKNLSYGFLDELGQLYFNNRESGSDGGNQFLKKVIKYEYKDQTVKPLIDNIWRKAYQSISYVNNIISHIENVDLNSHPDYKLIKGEAYALRAFLHFDLLRMFSESMSLNPNGRGIPYSKEFDLNLPELSDLKTTYDQVLSDLNSSEEISVSDTILDATIPASSFGKERTLHVNKYAVWAIKARVYLWKGDMVNAGLYAEKVIDSGKFNLYNSDELKDNVRYPSKKETVWAVYNDKLYSNLWDKFLWEDPRNPSFEYVRADIKEIYEVSSYTAANTDIRYSSYFLKGDHGTLFNRFLHLPKLNSRTGYLKKDTINGLTMIRLPEMYYIASEAYYDTNFAKSKKYFNDLRNSRGLADISDEKISSKDKLVNELLFDRVKEFWGEGQIFLEYKRLNRGITDKEGTLYPASKEMYVFPWPENELEFGNSFNN